MGRTGLRGFVRDVVCVDKGTGLLLHMGGDVEYGLGSDFRLRSDGVQWKVDHAPVFIIPSCDGGGVVVVVLPLATAGINALPPAASVAAAVVVGRPVEAADGPPAASGCCCCCWGGCLLRLRRLKRVLMPFFTWATVSGAACSVSESF